MAYIFFGCSMRGGRPFVSRNELADIANAIEALGHSLATQHQTKPGIIAEEDRHTKVFIHDREYGRMKTADCGIFEVSNPSLGVGSEISDMIAMKKPVLCLYRYDLYDVVSAYILGKAESNYIKTPYECYGYESLEGIRQKVEDFVQKISNR